MLSTGIVQIIQMSDEQELMARLGYPSYLSPIIGAWKILGIIVILAPKFPVLKEWAYAGFFFVITGAIASHLAANDPLKEFFGPGLLLVLIGLSWYFRPGERKLGFG